MTDINAQLKQTIADLEAKVEMLVNGQYGELRAMENQKKVGKVVLLNTYKESAGAPAQVVKSWNMLINEVNVVDGKIQEDQVVQINFFADDVPNATAGEITAQKARLGKLQKSIEDLKSSDVEDKEAKIAEVESKIQEELERFDKISPSIKVPLKNFYKVLIKVPLEVRSTRIDEDTGKVEFELQYEGKTYMVDQTFVN
jgi:hypothetical protein